MYRSRKGCLKNTTQRWFKKLGDVSWNHYKKSLKKITKKMEKKFKLGAKSAYMMACTRKPKNV
jgi:hypothetical protein